jgi:hypothetical protein
MTSVQFNGTTYEPSTKEVFVVPTIAAPEAATVTVVDNKDRGNRGARNNEAPKRWRKKCTTDYEFGPYARHVAHAAIYVLIILGVITLGMTTRMTYLGQGIYAICVAIIIYIWHFIGDFNKVDRSTEAFLERRGWNKYVCKVLTILNHHAISFVATLLLSGYLFSCVQTAVGGGMLIISSALYLAGLINAENVPNITGLSRS